MLIEMKGKNIILNFLIFAVLIYGVVGKKNILSEKTSPEHLKLPVKTITTENGDVYDCIDFFEQPAFDHPLLKTHDYHFDMKPSFVPREIPDNGKDKTKERFKSKRVGCPRGTVPIRRTTFINEKPSHLNSQTVDDDDSPIIYYAGTLTKDGIGKIYGASSSLSIENPKVYDANQFSSSIISIGWGPESLHVGWTVNPKLYGDYNTRFYIWTQAANASCYNIKCPGFVIVNPDHPLDQILLNAGNTGEPKREITVLVHQDKKSGDWWLVLEDDTPIGYWPERLFNKLSDGATKAYFGGVVACPPGAPTFPQMGTGNRPHNDNTPGNAMSRRMMLVNQDGNMEYAAHKSDILESLNERYVARNLRVHWWHPRKDLASTLLFGGS